MKTEMLQKIEKTREYLDYIEEHYNNVQRAWKEFQVKCKSDRSVSDDFHWGTLDKEIEFHDVSKLSNEELVKYRENFFPTKSESETKRNLNSAWTHHKEANMHHWENWATKNFHYPNEWEIHCVHMIIDWIAMSYKFGDTATEYYEKNKDEIKIPDYAHDYVVELLEMFYKVTK